MWSASGWRRSRPRSFTASTRPPAPCAPSRRIATTGWCSASDPCRPTPIVPRRCWPRPSSVAASARRRRRWRRRLRVAGIATDLLAAARAACVGQHEAAGPRSSRGLARLRDAEPARSARALAVGLAQRPHRRARVSRRRLGRRLGEAAGAVRPRRDAARRRRGRSPSSSSCWRRTDGRCRPPATCAASGRRTYSEVRKELRARYPRHPWPEDPWTAKATHRTVRRS